MCCAACNNSGSIKSALHVRADLAQEVPLCLVAGRLQELLDSHNLHAVPLGFEDLHITCMTIANRSELLSSSLLLHMASLLLDHVDMSQ